MKFDVLHNFISPVTGRILVNPNYIIVGNTIGVGIPSPILIDIRLDIIQIRSNYNTLVDAAFIIKSPNSQIPNAEILEDLMPIASVAEFPIPDDTGITLYNIPPEDLIPDPDTIGMAKIMKDGSIAIAIPDQDYVLPSTLVESMTEGVQPEIDAATAVPSFIVMGAKINALNYFLQNLKLNKIPANANVSLFGFNITNLENPIQAQDAATKNYVDNALGAPIYSYATGFVQMSSNATGTTLLANTWTAIAGTTTLVSSANTTMPANNELKYTGLSITALLQFSLTFTSSVIATVDFTLTINGVNYPGYISSFGVGLVGTGTPINISWIGATVLNTGDIVTIVVRSNLGGIITVTNLGLYLSII